MNLKSLASVLALFAFPVFAQQKPAITDGEAAKHVGEDATVTGKVFSVSTSGKGTTFLNFGAKFPNHTFGGVIFAKNASAVGDVKSYEGKEVSLTGRIELSPDQKPQIIINSADQIKLAADAKPVPAPVASTPAPPPPAPVPATPTPMPAAVPAPAPVPSPGRPSDSSSAQFSGGKIELAMTWNSARRGGEMVRKDLARLFGESGSPGETVRVDTSFEIYPGVPFLAPLSTAKKVLNLDGASSRKVRVTTPGLPQDSLSAHVFEGVFPGGYTRVHLVTDNADQVVSVLLVDSSSRSRVNNEPDTTGYHTYNFIAGDGKAVSYLAVRHQVTPASGASGVVVVDTMLVDPTDPDVQSGGRPGKGSSRSSSSSKPKTGKVLERSRWFVPSALVNLILRCVGG